MGAGASADEGVTVDGELAKVLSASDGDLAAARLARGARGGIRPLLSALGGVRGVVARGHGFARHPSGRVGVAMARRPGTFAVAFELDGDAPPMTFHTPKDRHFQGHGVFEPQGRYLFATENDFEGERGCLGIYDSADGYKRVGELPSHGVGCHELVLMPDGKTLAVANGGILTHPASGRAKLNIGTMAPNLAYVDLASGELMDKAEYTAGRKSKLSIRHLAVTPDGRIVFACQDQGDTADGLDLVAMHRPGSGGLVEWPAPEGLTLGLAGYCGSVAVNTAGTLAAVSAPRGNRQRELREALTTRRGRRRARGQGGAEARRKLPDKPVPVHGENLQLA